MKINELSEKQKKKRMSYVKYAGKYAIADIWLRAISNLYLFNELDKKGYDLVGISVDIAVFKKRKFKK